MICIYYMSMFDMLIHNIKHNKATESRVKWNVDSTVAQKIWPKHRCIYTVCTWQPCRWCRCYFYSTVNSIDSPPLIDLLCKDSWIRRLAAACGLCHKPASADRCELAWATWQVGDRLNRVETTHTALSCPVASPLQTWDNTSSLNTNRCQVSVSVCLSPTCTSLNSSRQPEPAGLLESQQVHI